MTRLGLRAVLMSSIWLGLCWGQSEAAWLGFRNDTDTAVVVQTGSLVGNRFVPGTPQKLLPRETSWEWIPEDSIRLVRVSAGGPAGAATARGLEVRVNKLDVLYAVRLHRLPNGEATATLAKVWEGQRKAAPSGK
jgi:hypothetical protein